MSEVKMISPVVKNVPWQEKPEGFTGAPIWRYSETLLSEETRWRGLPVFLTAP